MQFDQNILPMTGEAKWPVQICLLGNFRLLKGGQLVTLRHANKTESLLANLALGPGYALPRETLLQTLWPNIDLALASQSLNSLVYSLRKLLSDQIGGAPPIVQSDGYYRINVEAGVGLDVDWFTKLAKAGEQQAHAGNRAAAIDAYQRAVQLYQGDLCTCGDLQAMIEREYLRSLFLTLLARLADESYSDGDWSACLDYAMRLLSIDSCREDAHRLVMRCHVRQGERAQALHQYRLCQAVLRSEFDAGPEPATTTLYNQIRLEPECV